MIDIIKLSKHKLVHETVPSSRWILALTFIIVSKGLTRNSNAVPVSVSMKRSMNVPRIAEFSGYSLDQNTNSTLSLAVSRLIYLLSTSYLPRTNHNHSILNSQSSSAPHGLKNGQNRDGKIPSFCVTPCKLRNKIHHKVMQFQSPVTSCCHDNKTLKNKIEKNMARLRARNFYIFGPIF